MANCECHNQRVKAPDFAMVNRLRTSSIRRRQDEFPELVEKYDDYDEDDVVSLAGAVG